VNNSIFVVFGAALIMIALGGLFYVSQLTPPEPKYLPQPTSQSAQQPAPQPTPNLEQIKNELREEVRREQIKSQRDEEPVYQPEPQYRPTPVVIEVRHEYAPQPEPYRPTFKQVYKPIHPGDELDAPVKVKTTTGRLQPFNRNEPQGDFDDQPKELKPKSSKWKKVAIIAGIAAAGAGITYAATRR